MLIKKYTFEIIFVKEKSDYENIKRNDAVDNIILLVEKDPTVLFPSFIEKIDKNAFLLSTCYFYSFRKHIIDKNKDKITITTEEVLWKDFY